MVPIARPPWGGVGKKIESRIRKALYDYSMVRDVKRIAIALSGGKDSLTLLYMLKAISGHGFAPFELHAIYVGGEFSCGAGVTEGFLGAICDALGVPLTTCQSEQKRETLECYSCSRERRRLIFDAAKAADASIIAFGHHLDDNVETAMMNLLHKAEFGGIQPQIQMEKFGVTLIRPLIYVREAEITTFAEEHRFHRISCQCPVGQHSMRKKMKDWITEMERSFPNIRSNVAQAIQQYGSNKALTP